MADFLVESGNEGFFAFGLLTGLPREQVRQPIEGLLLPLGDLGRMNSILGGNLIPTFRSFFRGFRREAILYCRVMNKLYFTNLLSKRFYEKRKCKLRNVGLTSVRWLSRSFRDNTLSSVTPHEARACAGEEMRPCHTFVA